MQLLAHVARSQPALLERLVVAYLPGNTISASGELLIPICGTATQTRCFVSWNTLVEGADAGHWLAKLPPQSRAACVNPLSWRNDTRVVGRSAARGAMPVTGHLFLAGFDVGIVGAACSTEGMLFVSPDPSITGGSLYITDMTFQANGELHAYGAIPLVAGWHPLHCPLACRAGVNRLGGRGPLGTLDRSLMWCDPVGGWCRLATVLPGREAQRPSTARGFHRGPQRGQRDCSRRSGLPVVRPLAAAGSCVGHLHVAPAGRDAWAVAGGQLARVEPMAQWQLARGHFHAAEGDCAVVVAVLLLLQGLLLWYAPESLRWPTQGRSTVARNE